MSNQQKLIEITTQLGLIADRVTKDIGEVSSLVRQFTSQHSDIDFTGLDRAIDKLTVAAAALTSMVPDEVEAEDPSVPETPEETETPRETKSPAPAKAKASTAPAAKTSRKAKPADSDDTPAT